MIRDPLLFDHPQSKIMLDTIINDPTYKMDKSSFVKMISEYMKSEKKVFSFLFLSDQCERQFAYISHNIK